MFELSDVLDRGTQQLADRVPNSIGLNAGCELFNLFVTVATHDLGVCACISNTKITGSSSIPSDSLTSRTNLSGKETSTSQRLACTVKRLQDLLMDSLRMDQWYGPHLRAGAIFFSYTFIMADPDAFSLQSGDEGPFVRT